MRLATLLLLSILLCFSCKKDDTDDQQDKTGNCLTAVIDGEEFTATTTTGTAFAANIDYGNLGVVETQNLTIIGTIPSVGGFTKTMTLTFACTEFASDLNIDSTDPDCGIFMSYNSTSFTDPNASIVVNATQGGISIQEATDQKIKGTFTFKGEDQNGTAYNITNGFFDTTIN